MSRLLVILTPWWLCVAAGADVDVGNPDIGDPDIFPAPPVDIANALMVPNLFPDEAGDAQTRRTDPTDTPNPIPAGQVLPDLLGVSIVGWETDFPTGSLYEGSVDDVHPDLVRIDLVFDDLVNPPGTLGVNSLPFAPTKFGNSPLFGLLEIDIDSNINTGGDIGGAAELKYLANVGRFGNVAPSPLAVRTARTGSDYDLNFYSTPFFERSGCDWELTFCGCTEVMRESVETGDADLIFEAGESWIMSGRVFQRSPGYQQGSIMVGGTSPGLYNPIVEFRFFHYDQPGTVDDRTVVTLVYPLTMAGAAIMADEPVQSINTTVTDHTSIEEGADDLINGANSGSLFGENLVLQNGWAGAFNAPGLLDPSTWRSTALFGTSYPDNRPYLYIWTDVAMQTWGDLTGDGETDVSDQAEILAVIDTVDGTARDADGVANGEVEIQNPGPNFHVTDINGDGLINAEDWGDSIYDPPPPPEYPGDVNGDAVVDFNDLNLILSNWGRMDDFVFRGDGDLNNNGVVEFGDLNEMLANWGNVYP